MAASKSQVKPVTEFPTSTVSAARKRQNRADIPDPAVVPGANSWESGRTVQTRLEEMDFKR
jgi:hypothetical protein